MINSPCAHFLPSINKRLSDTPELSKQYCVLDVKYTAVSGKVVQKNGKSVRDNAERLYGRYSIKFNLQ